MPMKRFALALAAVALTAVTAFAADVAGTWNVDGDVVGNPVKFTTVWKQDGETLSGTATMEGKDVPVTGTVKDKAVTFEYDTDHEGTTYHLVFTGTLGENGAITGTIAVAGVEGTFTATKQ
jgi:opacity protein-like surface antigen